MKLAEIKKSIDSFLEDDEQKVLVIKGAWGSGKTYFWNGYLEKLPTRAKEYLEKQSYVSLFGVSKLDQIRPKIIAGSKEVIEGERARKEDYFGANLVKKTKVFFSKHKASIPEFQGLSFDKILGPAFERSVIKNTLVCFDDLERTEGVSIQELFGLVTELTHELECKVVIIYNENELKTSKSEEFSKYREKAVDLELLYQPTLEDNLAHVWKEDVPEEVREVFEEFQNNNIRVMKRVARSQKYFLGLLTEKSSPIETVLRERVALVTLIYYSYSEYRDLPKIRKLYWDEMMGRSEGSEEEDPLEAKVHKMLGHSYEILDDLVSLYLKQGYLDKGYAQGILEAESKKVTQYALKEKFDAIWEDLRWGIGIPQDEFSEKMRTFIKANYSAIGLNDINSVRKLLQECGEDVEELKDIEKLKLYSFVKAIPEDQFGRDIPDYLTPDLKKKIFEELEVKETDYTLQQVLEILGGSGSYSSTSYYKRVVQFSKEDFRSLLLAQHQQERVHLITLKNFFGRFLGDEFSTEVGDRIEEFRQELLSFRSRDKLTEKGILTILPPKVGPAPNEHLEG